MACYNLTRLLAVICFTWLGISAASAQGRQALLLGAQNYQHFNASTVTVAQHQALAEALRDQGFAVTVAGNPGNAAARAALADFSRKADRADFALIIASGHFATYREQSFFLPTNARVRRATDLFSRGLSAANIADIAHRAKAGAFLMLVTVPDIPSTVAGVGSQPGFARALPDNVTAVFSTSNKVPVSRVGGVSLQAMQKVIETAKQKPMTLAALIESASAGGAGRVFGNIADRDLSQDQSKPKPEPAKPAATVSQQNDAEEEKRKLVEERIKQAEERARLAEMRARDAEAKAKRDLEAATTAAEKRAAEARREAEKRAAEARREAEEKAQREIAAAAAAAARKAEEARQAEAARVAEAERRAEAERQAEAARQAAADREAANKAELARQAAASRQAEAARQAQAARQAEAARRAEAARKAEAERKLAEAKAAAQPQPSPPNIQSLQVVEALLGRGQRRVIQRILKAKGFYDGPLDAIFGDGTREAIRAFQRNEGAAETGYLTPDQFQQLIASR